MDEIIKILKDAYLSFAADNRPAEYTVFLRPPLWLNIVKESQRTPAYGMIQGVRIAKYEVVSIVVNGITFNFMERQWEDYKSCMIRAKRDRNWPVFVSPSIEPASLTVADKINKFISDALEHLYFPTKLAVND